MAACLLLYIERSPTTRLWSERSFELTILTLEMSGFDDDAVGVMTRSNGLLPWCRGSVTCCWWQPCTSSRVDSRPSIPFAFSSGILKSLQMISFSLIPHSIKVHVQSKYAFQQIHLRTSPLGWLVGGTLATLSVIWLTCTPMICS